MRRRLHRPSYQFSCNIHFATMNVQSLRIDLIAHRFKMQEVICKLREFDLHVCCLQEMRSSSQQIEVYYVEEYCFVQRGRVAVVLVIAFARLWEQSADRCFCPQTGRLRPLFLQCSFLTPFPSLPYSQGAWSKPADGAAWPDKDGHHYRRPPVCVFLVATELAVPQNKGFYELDYILTDDTRAHQVQPRMRCVPRMRCAHFYTWELHACLRQRGVERGHLRFQQKGYDACASVNSHGANKTSNNVAELDAILLALTWVQRHQSMLDVAVFHYDSEYAMHVSTGRWRALRNLIQIGKIKQLLSDLSPAVKFQWRWIRGHQGHWGNEQAGRLAAEERRECVRHSVLSQIRSATFTKKWTGCSCQQHPNCRQECWLFA